ncbi:hypothetical protein PSPO01_11617 [Paraphaeosphaeria sporulosa]
MVSLNMSSLEYIFGGFLESLVASKKKYQAGCLIDLGARVCLLACQRLRSQVSEDRVWHMSRCVGDCTMPFPLEPFHGHDLTGQNFLQFGTPQRVQLTDRSARTKRSARYSTLEPDFFGWIVKPPSGSWYLHSRLVCGNHWAFVSRAEASCSTRMNLKPHIRGRDSTMIGRSPHTTNPRLLHTVYGFREAVKWSDSCHAECVPITSRAFSASRASPYRNL